MKHNYASFFNETKHKSITSYSIPQISYIQVKMKRSTQNNSILLKTKLCMTHMTSNTHTHTRYKTVLLTLTLISKYFSDLLLTNTYHLLHYFI